MTDRNELTDAEKIRILRVLAALSGTEFILSVSASRGCPKPGRENYSFGMVIDFETLDEAWGFAMENL